MPNSLIDPRSRAIAATRMALADARYAGNPDEVLMLTSLLNKHVAEALFAGDW